MNRRDPLTLRIAREVRHTARDPHDWYETPTGSRSASVTVQPDPPMSLWNVVPFTRWLLSQAFWQYRMSRNLLPTSLLDEFRAHCQAEGWVNVSKLAPTEVLRMHHTDRIHMLLVSTRVGSDYLTTHGESERMAHHFIRTRRATNP